MEMHDVRACAVIVQQIPPDAVAWFLEWQKGVEEAAKGFKGFRRTDIYPPREGQGDQWVVVIEFDDEASLQSWLSSPVRQELVAKLRARAGDFELEAHPGGLGVFFTRKPNSPPLPGWKIVVSVVVGLYPTVMLLALFPGPYLAPLGFALSMLISNFLSGIILQWIAMPIVNKVLGPWLQANSEKQWAVSLGGLAAILVFLGGLVVLFQQMKIGVQ